MSSLLLFLLPLIVLVLLMRQQQRRLRQHQALIGSLEVGDEVVTTSGIFGTITSLDDDTAQLEVAPGLNLKVAKRAIGGIVPPPMAADDVATDDVATDDQAAYQDEEDERPDAGPVQDAS
jgi:preprotein translocase subunit YajC